MNLLWGAKSRREAGVVGQVGLRERHGRLGRRIRRNLPFSRFSVENSLVALLKRGGHGVGWKLRLVVLQRSASPSGAVASSLSTLEASAWDSDLPELDC